MKRTLIHNATIVNEGRSVQGSVVIEGDRIAEVLTYGKKLSVPCECFIRTSFYLFCGDYNLWTSFLCKREKAVMVNLTR